MIRTIINRNVPHLKNTSKDMFMKRNIITRRVSSLEQNSKEKLATVLLKNNTGYSFLYLYVSSVISGGLIGNYVIFLIEKEKPDGTYSNNISGFVLSSLDGIIGGLLIGVLGPLYIPLLIYDKVKNKENAQ
jgi:hypothetical protein